MTKYFLLVAAALVSILFIGSGCLENLGKSEKPAAVVNGEPITRQELDKELEARFGKQQVEAMIKERLVLQEAKKKSVSVSDEDVKKRGEQILSMREEFAMALQEKKIRREDFDKQVKLALMTEKLINLEIKDDDRKAFLEKNKGDLMKTRLSCIVVKTKPEADRILKELKAGGDFAAAAKKESLDKRNGEKGGDVGYFSDSAPLPPEFKKPAMSLKIGEVSDVVKVRDNYIIMKVTERKKTYEELKEDIDQRMADEKQKEYTERLRGSAKIENSFETAEAPKK